MPLYTDFYTFCGLFPNQKLTTFVVVIIFVKLKQHAWKLPLENAQNDTHSLRKTTETETFVSSLPFME